MKPLLTQYKCDKNDREALSQVQVNIIVTVAPVE